MSKAMFAFRCLAFSCLLLIGCGSPTSRGTDPLTTCEETDLPPQPSFFGSAAKDGKLAQKPEKPYIVVATHFLMHANSQAAAQTFQELMGKIQPAMQAAEGLMGATLTFSQKCGYARTMTVWKDTASMMKFVMGGAHGEAIEKIGIIASHFRTTHWNEEVSQWPPTWEQSKSTLTKATIKSYEPK